MGKSAFFTVLLAALVAVSIAQGVPKQRLRDMQCQREVQENPLHACRQVVDRQLTGRARIMLPYLFDARERCCQQLQNVNRECRCAAIRRMVTDYEQTMAPLEEGHHGWSTKQQEQEYYDESTTEQQQQQQAGQEYYGEAAQRQQQGEGYYGETAQRQQGQEYYGEKPQQQEYYSERPQQQEYYSEAAKRQQQGEGYYGETARRQQGQEYYGERPQQQQGEGYYGEMAGRQQGQEYYDEGAQQEHVTRMRLMRVRQYVARLPAVCQVEPLNCSVFSSRQY